MAMYSDRSQAGAALVAPLRAALDGIERPLLLGIPMGGMVVASAVADALRQPLGLIQTDPVIRAAKRGTFKSLGMYLADMPHVQERVVVVFDDGLHDDLEVHRTLLALKRRGAERLVFAAPALRNATAEMHASVVDAVICPHRVDDLDAVSLFEDVAPPSAAMVRALLLGEPLEDAPAVDSGAEDEAGAAPMLYQDMLVPMDFRDAAMRAFREARRMQQIGGGRITLLYIARPDAKPDAGKDRLEKLIAAEGADRISAEIRHGEPAEQILALVQQGDVDLVVMGTHGRAGLQKAVFGSVAEQVIRKSLAPVMVIR
ncbi:MAG: universal stress protein [Myxococcota bacterium]